MYIKHWNGSGEQETGRRTTLTISSIFMAFLYSCDKTTTATAALNVYKHFTRPIHEKCNKNIYFIFTRTKRCVLPVLNERKNLHRQIHMYIGMFTSFIKRYMNRAERYKPKIATTITTHRQIAQRGFLFVECEKI